MQYMKKVPTVGLYHEENVIWNLCIDDWNIDLDGGQKDALLRRPNIKKYYESLKAVVEVEAVVEVPLAIPLPSFLLFLA